MSQIKYPTMTGPAMRLVKMVSKQNTSGQVFWQVTWYE
jgi:hypothetical protein